MVSYRIRWRSCYVICTVFCAVTSVWYLCLCCDITQNVQYTVLIVFRHPGCRNTMAFYICVVIFSVYAHLFMIRNNSTLVAPFTPQSISSSFLYVSALWYGPWNKSCVIWGRLGRLGIGRASKARVESRRTYEVWVGIWSVFQ